MSRLNQWSTTLYLGLRPGTRHPSPPSSRMPLDFDIMLGSSPPLMGQSPILSYFNSLAQSRAASYAHFDTDKKSRSWSSAPSSSSSSSSSSNNTPSTNGGSSFYYYCTENNNNNNSSNNNNNNYNNYYQCNRKGQNLRHHHNQYSRGPQRTSSLPSTLFSRPVLDATSGGHRRPTLDAPLRPCIIVRDDLMVASSSSEPRKKRVVFADDRGLSLEHVRIMQEPSSCPPCWAPDFLDLLLGSDGSTNGSTNGLSSGPAWELQFTQPAANYRQFREHLEHDHVALENVIVKPDADEVSGTVKVRNLGFHKEVIVRWTADEWKTFEDVPCTYLPSGAEGTAVVNVFDTFRFVFRVPKPGKPDKDGRLLSRLSLCVCYRVHGDGGGGGTQEYWDNNKGANFLLEAPKVVSRPPSPPPAPPLSSSVCMQPGCKAADALQAKVPSWSEFASWNHLTNDAPYW